MSAHTKKHLIKEPTLNVVYHGHVYQIPQSIAARYDIGPIAPLTSEINKDAITADALFAELDTKYSKAGVLLQGLRHREGLSQINFAKKINVTQSDLSKMEHGKRPIGKIIAKRIAELFDLDYRIFLE